MGAKRVNPRQPKGLPVGGQFASLDRVEAEADLPNVPQTKRDFAIAMLAVDAETLDRHFTPQQVFDNAHRIYEYMNECGQAADSVSRESLFSYAADELGVDYDVLYDKWMSGVTPIGLANRVALTATERQNL